MIRTTRNYEYINSLVRGQIGNLLKLPNYEAILGCRRPNEVVQVLSGTSYHKLLTAARMETFADLMEIVTSTAFRSIQGVILSSPEPAKAILEDYRLLLESRSIVNSLRMQFNNGIMAEIGAIPLGAIPTGYYPLQEANMGHIKALRDSGLDRIVTESLETARSYSCTAPLLRIILHCGSRLLERIVEIEPQEISSMKKLVSSNIEVANLEMVFVSIKCRIDPQTIRNWLLGQRDIREDVLGAVSDLRDVDLLLTRVKSHYRFCLEAKSGETVDDLVGKLPYCMMLGEARSALAGYPFKASTVAAGMMLRLLEIRNMRLAIAGASGQLGKVAALKLMIIP